MSDKWTILLTGPNNGLVGGLGESFENSPCHYERVDVVRADLYDRLREALESSIHRIDDMLMQDDGQAYKEAERYAEKARDLLAELDNLENGS